MRFLIRQKLCEAQKDAVAEGEHSVMSKSDLMETENRLIKWSVGLAVVQAAVIVALIKLL
ncbi:hypothetical protein SAMN05428977_10371 [Nitrosomonas sp. Nm166]|nr:hypothetical protein SAMN05428977_10371 [Nitrosomonas sp. Nm166]